MHFSSIATVLLAVTPFTIARPLWGSDDSHGKPHDYPEWRRAWNQAIRGHISRTTPGRWPNASSQYCDLSKASMPVAPTPLPSPASGMVLSHVAVGQGTQNYTCTTNSATETPTAIGAVATLYNATCVAADWPDLLAMMPTVALNTRVAASTGPTKILLSGHHYFLDSKTAFFNLDTDQHSYGTIGASKFASSNAPSNALTGVNGDGFGAVPWLKLTAKDNMGNPFQEVYRLNTAGGQPPATCEGYQGTFEIGYSAEYWLYVKP